MYYLSVCATIIQQEQTKTKDTIMPKLRHFDNCNSARFVTFTCYHRYKLLVNPSVIETFLRHLAAARDNYSLKLLSYVVMPEHVHMVVHPPQGSRLGLIVGRLKSLSARDILARHLPLGMYTRADLLVKRDGKIKHAFWQSRCYDHNCRSREKVIEKINYCHWNPVRRELVRSPEDWQGSSYRWYQGKEVSLRPDGFY